MSRLRIPAVYMRGGTSKGLFFERSALPEDAAARDALLLRIIGSPDPYGQHIDGMGGATSSTSKVVLVAKSARPDSDVDYWFGQVAIDRPVIDWSGNCGNLTAAVGPYAIDEGLVDAPRDGVATVRLWQANIGKRIVAEVPVRNGTVVECGDFELDGVAFPAAEVRLAFLDPGGGEASPLFPTGHAADTLQVPGYGALQATMINAGNPTIFVAASDLGCDGTELPRDFNSRSDLLARCEAMRAHGAVAMGLAASADDATTHRPHTPKLALVAPPRDYIASSGRTVVASSIDLAARIVSMGKLHHAMTGTGAIAVAAAAAVRDTVVQAITGDAGLDGRSIRFGHASGVLRVGAEPACHDGSWRIAKVTMSRSARRLMEGWVRVPAPFR
jgi:hypothetical protein